jgi:5-methylthioadenosine/S-adenosylhomocysteine deaminase
VVVGSDQAHGNNCNDILNQMTLTALFNKIRYRDPTVMPAWEAVRIAMIERARAIGLGDEIGSLEVGKQADLILVDLTALNLSPVLTQPVRNISVQSLIDRQLQRGLGREALRAAARTREWPSSGASHRS